jgi:PAS domain-containing protein
MTPSQPGPEGRYPSTQHGHLAPFASAAAGARSPAFQPPWRRSRSDFHRIRRDVLALAALVVVLAVGVVVQSSMEDRSRRLAEAGARALETARAVEQHVARLIDSNGQFLYDLRTQVEAEGGVNAIAPERLRFLLGSQRLYDQATRRVFLADAEGRRTAIVAGADGIPASIAHREYFTRHLREADRGIAVDPPFSADGRGGDRVMPISVRLDQPGGGFGGVAVLSLDLAYLAQYFGTREVGADGSVALLMGDGRFAVRHPALPADGPAPRVIRMPAFPGVQGVMEAASPVDGTRRLVAWHKVADYPLYAVVAVSRDEVLRAWMRSSFLRVALGGAVIGVIALFTVLLLARLEADRAAQARLARFERALDQAGDLVYWVTEDGRIVYLNEAAARRYAPHASRMPPVLTLHDIAAHHTPASWKPTWDELARRGTLRFEAEHLTHDGRAYPVEVSASRQEAEGAGFALFIVRERGAA